MPLHFKSQGIRHKTESNCKLHEDTVLEGFFWSEIRNQKT